MKKQNATTVGRQRAKARQRAAALAAGAYDGRYKARRIPDKKKVASRNACHRPSASRDRRFPFQGSVFVILA